MCGVVEGLKTVKKYRSISITRQGMQTDEPAKMDVVDKKECMTEKSSYHESNTHGKKERRFGGVEFTDEEQKYLNTLLHRKLGKEEVSYRPGPGNKKLAYVESCKVIQLANQLFGYNGWSCKVVECKEEYVR